MKIEDSNRKKLIDSRISLPIIIFIISIFYCDNSDIMKIVKDSDLWKRINLDIIFVTLLMLFFIISKYYFKVFVLFKVFLLIKVILMLLDFTKSLYVLHKK